MTGLHAGHGGDGLGRIGLRRKGEDGKTVSAVTHRSSVGWLDRTFPFEVEGLALLSCGYRNGTDRMVIVRCLGPQEFFLERVVFPFELLSFECPPASEVEIWTHGLGGPELLETLDVSELLIEPPSLEAVPAAEQPSQAWQQAS